MSMRQTLAVSAALALAAAGAAHAAPARPKPKPVCNLVTDPANDTFTGAKSLDILSADVATDGKVVTGVIRFAKLVKPTEEPASPTGGFYQLQFTYNGSGHVLTAHITPKGEEYGPTGKSTGKYDLAKNEVRIHVKATELAGSPVFKPGSLLTNFVVRTDIGNPTVPVGSTFQILGDSASGNKPYPVGYPSCVRPGA